MMDPLNPKRLALPTSKATQKTNTKPPRHKPGEKFLKGPIPWIWLVTAAHQPGKALHVAIVLWFLAGVKRTRTVALSGTVLRALGVNRHSSYRGLAALEQAGLVSVERHPGRNPVVTLREVMSTCHSRQNPHAYSGGLRSTSNPLPLIPSWQSVHKSSVNAVASHLVMESVLAVVEQTKGITTRRG